MSVTNGSQSRTINDKAAELIKLLPSMSHQINIINDGPLPLHAKHIFFRDALSLARVHAKEAAIGFILWRVTAEETPQALAS